MTEKIINIKTVCEQLMGLESCDKRTVSEVFSPAAEQYGIVCAAAFLNDKRTNKDQTFFFYSDTIPDGLQSVEYSLDIDNEKNMCAKLYLDENIILNENDVSDIEFLCCTCCSTAIRFYLADIVDHYHHYDKATGMYNLNALEKFCHRISAAGKADQYTAFFFNIISFNYVNRKAGYKYGTEMLRQYGSKLNEFAGNDGIIVRIGGDNFGAFIPNVRVDEFLKRLDRTDITVNTETGKLTFSLSARAGIYQIDEPNKDFGMIMNYISATANYAKNFSRTPIVTYSPQIEEEFIARKEYTQRFARSLENGDFYVLYQPKVCTDGNSIYGGEALVRWVYDGQTISPAEFVPVLEKEHLICALDYFVLEKTCQTIREWIDQGITPAKISVNFSNEHLYEDDLVERITEITDRYGIDHKYIEMELTETVDPESSSRLKKYVDGLHANGFTVALDDFGTGYSSLQLLNFVNVDVLKIDKSFVNELSDDTKNRENIILRNIINMAVELGIEIVAEGVENNEQKVNLENLRCNRIQGYIYDKPLAADEFAKRLKAKIY